MDANEIIERRACITGVGQSAIGRRLGTDPLELTLDGCLAAIADAPTFGPDAYAYKLTGTTMGLRVGTKYSPTPHSLLGCGFLRLDTRAQGGNNYTKSMPEITFDYRF